MIDIIIKLEQNKLEIQKLMSLLERRYYAFDSDIKELYKKEINNVIKDKTSFIFFYWFREDGGYDYIKGFYNKSFKPILYKNFVESDFTDTTGKLYGLSDKVERLLLKDEQVFILLRSWLKHQDCFLDCDCIHPHLQTAVYEEFVVNKRVH